MAPRTGISLPLTGDGGPMDVRSAARRVEDFGFESVWVPDVVVGDGEPAMDALLALATAAGATERVRLGVGVLVLPLRPLPWLAVQVASLQQLSGDRMLLGVGSGGFPTAPFWRAMGVTGGERARATDEALRRLPELLAGAPSTVDTGHGPATLTFGRTAAMPTVLVGGNSAAAMRRAVTFGAAWFPSLISAEALTAAVRRLRTLTEPGRPAPTVTVGVHYAPTPHAHAAFVRTLVDVHGMDPADATALGVTGSPGQVAARLHDYATAGADRIVLAPTNENWPRDLETLADAAAQLD